MHPRRKSSLSRPLTGSALTDREEILSSLDPAKGKDAVRAAIRQWTMIMDGKARALANDAKKNMGPFGGTLSVLDEDNIARHDKIAGAQNPAQQGKGAPKDASQPAPATLAGKPTGANGKTEDRLGAAPQPVALQPSAPPARPANVPADAGYSPSTGLWYDAKTHQPIQ